MSQENAKAIVLMSDGGMNINSVQSIVDYANKNSLIIHCLGIGTLEGGGDDSGAWYKIDEDALKLIAENSGGRYYSIRNIEDFYYALGSLIEVTKKNSILDLSIYSIIIAAFLILIDFYFINNRFRVFP